MTKARKIPRINRSRVEFQVEFQEFQQEFQTHDQLLARLELRHMSLEFLI